MTTLHVFQTNVTFDPVEAVKASPKLSKKYNFADSQELISRLTEKGFTLDETSYAKVKNFDRSGFQKHIMIFSHPDLGIDENNSMRLLVTNSHDGRSSLRFNLGIYRAICANGLVVGDDMLETRIRHDSPRFIERVDETLDQFTREAPMVASLVRKMKETTLPDASYRKIAMEIASNRVKNVKDVAFIDAESALIPQRDGDSGKDLWTVFNILQEKAIRGGFQYTKVVPVYDEHNGNIVEWTSKNATTRDVTSIDKKTELNRSMWNIVKRHVA